ncbi:MAG: squalene/phytoene synthase family protein, partial [Nitrospinaceae bacterium]
RRTMQRTAVSFGLGLQMTNICKDVVVDRGRRWSYIPRSYIMQQGLSVEEFSSGGNEEKSMQVLNRLLHKTLGHLEDALEFTLAIPAKAQTLRLFCIWPLWMALETVAVLHNNPALLQSGDPVKISRQAVRRILRRTRLMCFSDLLLKWSFGEIRKRTRLAHPPGFELDELKERLDRLGLNPSPVGADGVKS